MISRIGGITEDLTQDDVSGVYIVTGRQAEARRLAKIVRALGYRVRVFDSAAKFLDIAAVLAPGCVLLDLRRTRNDTLAVPRELRARSIALPTIALDTLGMGASAAVAAMKAGAIDYLVAEDEALLATALKGAIEECKPALRSRTRDSSATAQVASLTPREREVLVGLVDGGTNKTIALQLGISPRTVELHRAQVMHRLHANSLTELLQIALAAGVTPATRRARASAP